MPVAIFDGARFALATRGELVRRGFGGLLCERRVAHGQAEGEAKADAQPSLMWHGSSLLPVEEGADHRRPDGDGIGRVDEKMSVAAMRRKEMVLGIAASSGERSMHSFR